MARVLAATIVEIVAGTVAEIDAMIVVEANPRAEAAGSVAMAAMIDVVVVTTAVELAAAASAGARAARLTKQFYSLLPARRCVTGRAELYRARQRVMISSGHRESVGDGRREISGRIEAMPPRVGG